MFAARWKEETKVPDRGERQKVHNQMVKASQQPWEAESVCLGDSVLLSKAELLS